MDKIQFRTSKHGRGTPAVRSTDGLDDARLMDRPIDEARRKYLEALQVRKDRLTEEAMLWDANMPPSDAHGR